MTEDFPGGTVDKYLPANAGDLGSNPGLRGFRMHGATKSFATTTEPMCCNCWSLRAREPELHSKRSHCNQKPVHGYYLVHCTHTIVCLPFISQRTLGLLPNFSCENAAIDMGCINLSSRLCFQLFWVYIKKRNWWDYMTNLFLVF